MPPFSVDPDLHCQVTYTAKVTDPDGNEYLCPDCFDPITQIFTFHHDADLDVSGPTSKMYSIEITGSSGYLTAKQDTASFTLEVHNPCIDPAFVTIETVSLDSFDYSVNQQAYEWTHQPFDIATVPIVHSLCGALTYGATFKGDIITVDSVPVKYDNTLKTFQIFTDDPA